MWIEATTVVYNIQNFIYTPYGRRDVTFLGFFLYWSLMLLICGFTCRLKEKCYDDVSIFYVYIYVYLNVTEIANKKKLGMSKCM